MNNVFRSILLFVLSGSVSYAQNNEIKPADSSAAVSIVSPAATDTKGGVSQDKGNEDFIFKPSVGLGTGVFSFYGDIYAKHFQAPMVSRIAYELNVAQNINNYLQFNFHVLYGKLGANERQTYNSRNLNFESQIRTGGVNLTYNFDQLLPKDRVVTPYISLGFESFEFLSKTDLYDQYGNKYNYWSDGTIRNLPQTDPNSGNAMIIHRDYTYESDIRQTNQDGFGKYPEHSFAIPVGAGFSFKLNDFLNFKMGATMHYTFTDYIDGVTNKSKGNRAGNSKNDNFMMSSFSLSYNFGVKKNEKNKIDENIYKDVDFMALQSSDLDNDGVTDEKDSCQGTPAGVPVDIKGCPLDDDKDGVPNYMDDELNTPIGAFVDAKGVQLSDSLIAYQYAIYMDSTGAFAKVEVHDHNGNSMRNALYQKEYSVELGTFKKGLAPELMTKFLSINDISSTNIDDSTTIYVAGKYDNLLDAENRKKQLAADGLTDAKVVYKQNGKYLDAPLFSSSSPVKAVENEKNKNSKDLTDVKSNKNSKTNLAGSNNPKNNSANAGNHKNNVSSGNTDVNMDAINKPGVVLRIQLGAYHNRLSKSVFKGIDDLIEIKTEEGLYKYMTGSFSSFDQAAKYKVELLTLGLQGAFITAYKDGKRITLEEAGATAAKKSEKLDVPENANVNAVSKKLVTFKVQIGVFKNDPPEDKLAVFSKIKDMKGESTSSGLKRYVVGSFNDFASAEALKNNIIKTYGISDAFVIAYYNNETISIQEALELLK